MGSDRYAYPSGGASASAAYHFPAARPDDPSLYGERLRFLGAARGYNNLVACGDTSASFELHNNELFGEGLLSQFHNRSCLAPYRDIGVSGVAQSHWRRPTATYSLTMRSDSQPSHGQGFHPGAYFSRLPSSSISTETLRSFPHTFAGNALQAQKKPLGSSQSFDTAAARKRKPQPLDALVKDTWELHSLFRAGLVADSKKSKRSGNGWDNNRSRLGKHNETHTTNDVLNTGGKWEDRLSLEEEDEDPSSWKELDAPCKETISDIKQKDSSLSMDTKQEQCASSVQRSLCMKVKTFMGDSSDNCDSDEESLVDSDDGGLNLHDESSHDIKSREEQAYEFFLQMFEENKDLQKLFNEQSHVGKFECLVCSGVPGKRPKKYSGLTSVIMHSSKIIKTKKKQEHRGYARALCSVMGWDICRLPSMALGSSPNPRCCIPAHKEENEGCDKIEEASKETETLHQKH